MVRESTQVLSETRLRTREVDPCVFRRVVGEKVYLLTLYVDDILLIAERVEIERMEKAFVAR